MSKILTIKEMGAKGGNSTVNKYGRNHMKNLQKKSVRARRLNKLRKNNDKI